MRPIDPVPTHRTSLARAPLLLGPTLILASVLMGCSSDRPAGPAFPVSGAASIHPAGDAIVVSSAAELAAALAPENAGRRVLARAGTYTITVPLVVPDGVTLEGEGDMQFDGDGLPAGFGGSPHTTLLMSGNVPGNMLTLGDDVTIRRLQIVDAAGRSGNVIGVVSRDAGDQVSATIAESEIVNPNPLGNGPDGPTGYGLLILTRNPNLGASPAPHEGAILTTRMVRSLVRSPGGGGSVFAFNFAALGNVSVALTGNVLGGEITANGGVSRPDAVHDATVAIESQRNLYRADAADPCAPPRRGGWNLTGGSGPPAPLPVSETARNSLRVHSVDDRIERSATAVVATGSRRFFPTQGPSTANSVDLQLHGTRISTASCGGTGSDLILEAASVPFASGLAPGDDNTLHVVIEGVTGSGLRVNEYSNAAGPSGPLPPALQGIGNRLTIAGSPIAFAHTNQQIDPMPGGEFFSGGTP